MTHPTPRRLAFSAVLLCALIAQPATAADDAAQLFKDGRTAMTAEDYATAADKLKKSYALDPSPGTLLNLAICEVKLERLGDAWLHLQSVLADLPQDDARRPIAEDQIADIEGRVPWLTFRLRGEIPERLEIMVDRRSIDPSKLNTRIPVNPGTVEVVISTATGQRSLTVRVAEGQRKEVFVDESDKPAADQASEATSSTPTAAYILLGVGAAGVAVGSYLFLDLSKKRDTADNNCDAANLCNDKGMAAAEDGKALVPIYTGAWIVGAAGLAAGTYFLFSSGDPADASTQVGATPLPGGAALGMKGRF